MKPTVTSPFAAIVVAFTCLGLSTGVVVLAACSSPQQEVAAQNSPSADKAPSTPAVAQARQQGR